MDRLAAFEPAGAPVLSVYLDTRPDEHGRDHYQPFLRKELRARSESLPPHTSDRESYERDADRIREWTQRELSPSSNGAAIFCCGAADLFEPVQLEVPVEGNRFYVGPQPHIYPLARLLSLYPRYAALVADTHLARLFVFGLGKLLRERTLTSPKTRRTEAGGWSQKSYQSHVDDSHRQHAKQAAEALEQMVRLDRIAQVVIAGDEVIIPLLREQLSPPVAEKIVDVLSLDIRTPDQEVLQETRDALRRRSAEAEGKKARQLLDDYRAGGLAAVGPRATEAALARGQARELLITADPTSLEELDGERASTQPGPGADPAEWADRLVRSARNTDAAVTMIGDPALLAEVGGVGAMLRYPLDRVR